MPHAPDVAAARNQARKELKIPTRGGRYPADEEAKIAARAKEILEVQYAVFEHNIVCARWPMTLPCAFPGQADHAQGHY
jgi:hypothetical protein